jgi:hypothetical protein
MTMRAFVRWLVLSMGVVALAYLAVLAMVTVRWVGDFVEGFLLMAVVGGAIVAGMRFVLERRKRIAAVADPFSRDVFSTDTINISHVRVAGLGGAGLVLAAFVVGLQYQLTTVAMAAGVVGGVLLAVALIVFRRRKLA